MISGGQVLCMCVCMVLQPPIPGLPLKHLYTNLVVAVQSVRVKTL